MTDLSLVPATSLHEFDYSLIEFTQMYPDGQSVCKRGLDATPMVVRKYGLGSKEVMCFSNHEKRNRGLTAFHFHPEFPLNQRKTYMENHRDGFELVTEIEAQRLSERQIEISKWKTRLNKSGKSIAMLVNSLVIYAVTHHPDSH